MSRPLKLPTCLPARDFRQLDLELFRKDIAYQCQQCLQGQAENTHDIVNDYDTPLRMVLDKHAPSKDIVRRGTRPYPWYNGNVEEARATKRQCGHCWRKAKLEVNRQLYVEARNSSTVCIAKAKSEYYQDTLQREYYHDTLQSEYYQDTLQREYYQDTLQREYYQDTLQK